MWQLHAIQKTNALQLNLVVTMWLAMHDAALMLVLPAHHKDKPARVRHAACSTLHEQSDAAVA
jgi:hypothetical protein